MKRFLGLIFIMCAVLFVINGIFFLVNIFIARLRPDIMLFTSQGYFISLFVAIVCFCFAYTLFMIGRRLRAGEIP